MFIKTIIAGNSIFENIKPVVHEPLFQHYGISTTWIDLVDNIWVALWFACYKANSSGGCARYLHFEKRNPFSEPSAKAYILLIGTDFAPTGVPGYHRGKSCETVDLRVAAPSIFLRPHAQHGLLFRMKGTGAMRPIDYAEQIRGIISINLREALSWLGEAPTLSVHGLFPPPLYDAGYRMLLDGTFEGRPEIGSIALVGA